jgi:hypothetical protein
MKTTLIILGLMTAAAVRFVPYVPADGKHPVKEHTASKISPSPLFKWTEVSPPGSGTLPYEWKAGTYASGITPLVGFNNDLWMIGQNRAWSSQDGINWQSFDKTDWGEKISMAHVFFNNKYWVLGGMAYSTNTFLNEIWNSIDGKTFTRVVQHADWSPRKGQTVVAFKNRLWMFGGSTGVGKDRSPNEFNNEVWSSSDGLKWTKVADAAPWAGMETPRLLIFKDKLWMIGGQGHSDTWSSGDGKNWTQVSTDSPWKERYDYGAAVFDNLLWVYGGDNKQYQASNDVWFSFDGSRWFLQTQDAPWTPRCGTHSVVFQDKLWLYGGKHKGFKDSYSGDIWTLEPAPDGRESSLRK